MIAVLFARRDSVYKTLPEVDVWDADRNALTWPGGAPVIAHPPCRAWGRLRNVARPAEGEKELALWAVRQVRQWGGILEHPAGSLLWQEANLPAPSVHDAWHGWTLPIVQHWWGHPAEKKTWLYIVGCQANDLPPLPLRLGAAPAIVGTPGRRRDGTRLKPGEAGWRPEIAKADREHTPPALAEWLVTLASRCTPPPARRKGP